jgi:hypothetical protein
MARISDKRAREAAEREGLLGAEVLGLPTKRWPQWTRVRYVGEQPRSGPNEVAKPLTADEAS